MIESARTQRVTTWLAILGYAVLASGLPLPLGLLAPPDAAVADARLAAKDRSRPFPCMDKPCGCATADQCFTNCCCHTPAERLAWAQANAVEPAVLEALERRVAADTAPSEPTGGCCAASSTSAATCANAGGRDAADTADVCMDFQSLAADPPSDDAVAAAGGARQPDATRNPTPSRLRTVTLRAMLACGGILTTWLAVGGSPPPPRVEFALETPLVAVCISGDRAAAGLPAAPALPPPRAA